MTVYGRRLDVVLEFSRVSFCLLHLFLFAGKEAVEGTLSLFRYWRWPQGKRRGSGETGECQEMMSTRVDYSLSTFRFLTFSILRPHSVPNSVSW